MKSLNIPYNPRLDQLRWLAATIVFLFRPDSNAFFSAPTPTH